MFKQRIRELRKAAGYTQLELAKKMGYSQQLVAKWEAGISSPDPDVLKNIADILKCTVDALISSCDDKDSKEEEEDAKKENLQVFYRAEQQLSEDKLNQLKDFAIFLLNKDNNDSTY